jgi:hypothetical protein
MLQVRCPHAWTSKEPATALTAGGVNQIPLTFSEWHVAASPVQRFDINPIPRDTAKGLFDDEMEHHGRKSIFGLLNGRDVENLTGKYSIGAPVSRADGHVIFIASTRVRFSGNKRQARE